MAANRIHCKCYAYFFMDFFQAIRPFILKKNVVRQPKQKNCFIGYSFFEIVKSVGEMNVLRCVVGWQYFPLLLCTFSFQDFVYMRRIFAFVDLIFLNFFYFHIFFSKFGIVICMHASRVSPRNDQRLKFSLFIFCLFINF